MNQKEYQERITAAFEEKRKYEIKVKEVIMLTQDILKDFASKKEIDNHPKIKKIRKKIEKLGLK